MAWILNLMIKNNTVAAISSRVNCADKLTRSGGPSCSAEILIRACGPFSDYVEGIASSRGRVYARLADLRQPSPPESSSGRCHPSAKRRHRLTPLASRSVTRSAPSGAGTPGNLRQGSQRRVDRRRVRKQVGNFGVKDNNVGTRLESLDVFPADQLPEIRAFILGTKFVSSKLLSLPHRASSLPALRGER